VSRPLVLFVLMSVIWGIPYLFIRIAVAEVSPAFLVMARTGIAAAILLPIALLRTDLRPVLGRWRWLVGFAAIEIAIPWVLLASAEQKVTSSLAALVIAGVPLVGVAIALLTGRSERMGPIGLLGLVVGIVGVAVIVGGDLGSTDPIAIIELSAVAVCYALGPVILARRLSDVPAAGVMSLSLGLTCLVYIPFAALQWPTAVPSPAVIGSIATLAIVCTAIAFLVFAALIDAVGPVRSTVITYINPAVAALLGVFVLNETLTPAMIAGFALVTLGSVLATRTPRHEVDAVPAVTSTG
jgi:drug/metabolite transporter (DMT)-like permease